MSCIPPQKYRDRYIDYMTNVVFENTEENFLLNNLCASQNLNNVMNKINKDKKFNEDNKSENSYKMCGDKYNATNKNSNNLNVISEEQRFNFLNKMSSVKSNIDTREINDK